ncbi:hypothetical protein N9J66_05305 [Gammaproteobacteria bacterium]|jgi:hypothetical protein|nr:hypothetical protein [Gammaproteobacteria bacterium]
MKKHTISIVKAIPSIKQKKFKFKPNVQTKTFYQGRELDEKYKGNKWWAHKTVQWNTLEELYKILEPYCKGTHKDSLYSALMYGEFREGCNEPDGYRRQNANIEDTPHNYLILDIETDSPEYEGTCHDLNLVRGWLIETYPWIEENTGMILYHTASSCVVRTDGSEKHKQIRVRAIMEIDSDIPLHEADRKHLLRPYMKGTGKDFYRHIDKCTHEKTRLFFIAPPLLKETERLLTLDDTCRLHKGNPIDYDSLRDFEIGLPLGTQSGAGVPRSDAVFNQRNGEQRFMKKNPPEWHWEKIGDGARYDEQFNLLGSAHYKDDINRWRKKLLGDPHKLGTRTEIEIDSMIKWIEEHMIREYDKPSDKISNHNVIDIPEHRLSVWKDKYGDSITWKDKSVVLQKLYEGAGKTESLIELMAIAKEEGKSFLYIAPNEKTVINTCKELGLASYKEIQGGVGDISSKGEPIHSILGICYPSLEYLKGGIGQGAKDGLKWDIVAIDEIEQTLLFATDGGGCIQNPHKANHILRDIVERAGLVVGMDARLSNLSLQALEIWREKDGVFDIYTQSKVKPWTGKTFTMVDNKELTLNYIREAVRNGKKVAIVSELTRGGRGLNLENGRRYIEEQTGKLGWSVDQNNKRTEEATAYINELGQWTEDGRWKIGKLEKDLIDGKLSHVWISPVLQSAWSYLSEEANFDLVVGLYPNRVLTAPNIVQHISRFRKSTEYVMYVEQNHRYAPYDIYKQMYPTIHADFLPHEFEKEFNLRHEMHLHFETWQLNNRQNHLIEIIENRGGVVEYDYSKLEEDDKEAFAWIKKNNEEAIKFIRSQRAFNIYKKYADDGKTE